MVNCENSEEEGEEAVRILLAAITASVEVFGIVSRLVLASGKAPPLSICTKEDFALSY